LPTCVCSWPVMRPSLSVERIWLWTVESVYKHNPVIKDDELFARGTLWGNSYFVSMTFTDV
jgi:hypothetical protein